MTISYRPVSLSGRLVRAGSPLLIRLRLPSAGIAAATATVAAYGRIAERATMNKLRGLLEESACLRLPAGLNISAYYA